MVHFSQNQLNYLQRSFFESFGCSVDKLPRGARNNNPANIRHSSSRWRGLSSVQHDKSFCCFDNVLYGIRALLRTLRTYSLKYHLISVYDVISRFAPSSENDVDCYISNISNIFDNVFGDSSINRYSSLNLWKDDTFEPVSAFLLYKFCYAICFVECGYKLDKLLFYSALEVL